MTNQRVDGMAIAALIVLALMVTNAVWDRMGKTNGPPLIEQAAAAAAGVIQQGGTSTLMTLGSLEIDSADAQLFAAPYDDYALTQGLHGFAYGHSAIDIAAGKGATIKSPINGDVTNLYIDEYGNTTLILENAVYKVTLMHGNYSVKVGERVAIGQALGTESNNGYTVDWQGVPCYGRDCGYHTHLNVFDKLSGSNVNPLDLIK